MNEQYTTFLFRLSVLGNGDRAALKRSAGIMLAEADGKAITDPQKALEGTKYLAYLSQLETTIDIAQMITLEMEDNN